MYKSLIFLSFFSITYNVFASPKLISETLLLRLAEQGSPRLDEIEAAMLEKKFEEGEAKWPYSPELFGRGAYSETNEKAIIAFQPVFTPTAQVLLGVRQNLQKGLTAEAKIIADQRSSSSSGLAGKFHDTTTTTLSFTMQLDVWKNLFGRLTKAHIEQAEFETKRAELKKDVETKAFKLSLRRLYWSLVANQEALKISEGLLKTSEIQANEANLRYKNAVADSDEVARYQAQVTSRKGSILHLKYQRETLITQLKNLLPRLGPDDVVLDKYDISKTINQVLTCTAGIAMEPSIPYQHTRYDEMVALLRKIQKGKRSMNERYSDADVKLFGTVKTTGVSSEESGDNRFRGSYGGSIDDIQDNNRSGYEVGVMFTYPLGSVKEATQKTKELWDEKRTEAAISGADAQVINSHIEIVKSVGILQEVIHNQRMTSDLLNKRLLGMKRKYQQARVSVNDMIMDQDALFNSELNTIQTQLQMLLVLFDYLVVFTDTPCEFNRN